MFPARGVKPFETRRFVEGLSGPARSSGVGLDQATFASRSNALLHLRASNRPRQVGARRPGSRCEGGRGVSPATLRITTDGRGILNPVVSIPATSCGFMGCPPNQRGDTTARIRCGDTPGAVRGTPRRHSRALTAIGTPDDDGRDVSGVMSRGRRTAGHPARRTPGVAGWEPRVPWSEPQPLVVHGHDRSGAVATGAGTEGTRSPGSDLV